jgi:hypothetical protein
MGPVMRPVMICPPGIPNAGNPSSKVIQLIELQQSAKARGQSRRLANLAQNCLGFV